MTSRKEQLASESIKKNWAVSDVRHVLPLQLRPHKKENLYLMLSKISKGKTDEVHKLLHEAVLHHKRAAGKKSVKIRVTMKNVKSAQDYFKSHNEEGTRSDGNKVP